MAHLIDKDTLLARIKKLKMDIGNMFNEYDEGFWEGRAAAFDDVICALNTIEVKEVNLEKESELIANEIMFGVQANKYHTNVYNTKRNDFNHSHLMIAVRKGIELGLKAQKGE